MSRELTLADSARADLIDIWSYIAEDSVRAADSFVNRLLKRCQLLADNPEVGKEREQFAEGLRSFPFDRIVVFYRFSESSVEIARVLSGYRDLDSLF